LTRAIIGGGVGELTGVFARRAGVEAVVFERSGE
jgi:hypothetical protein